MLELAVFLGIYSYLIFLLGIFGFLCKNVIIISTLIYFFLFCIYFFKNRKISFINISKLDNFSKLLISLLFIQSLINIFGALGPETSFDALWYHLTLPKLYLQNHLIYHIPGNLLYYSDMPKNIEMLFVTALAINGEIIAKLISFLFGILCLVAIYKLAREFLSKQYSLIAVLIFYSNLVVGWQSITSYVDLGRTFFEIVSFIQFYLWIKTKRKIYLISSAVITGFSIATKTGALDSLLIYLFLILAVSNIKQISKPILNVLLFFVISIIVASPWFIFSLINTGNPFYPIFSNILTLRFGLEPLGLIKNLIIPSDPINPIYLILIPLVIVFFKKFDFKLKILTVYSLLGILFWFLNSSIGGTRYLLPYLPILSILSAISIFQIKEINLKKYLIGIVLFLSLVSIFYRGIANSKYLPVILGKESKQNFLIKNLNYSFGDFYDTDGYFKKHIKSSDKVLLFGFHNLYYVDFPYIDSSWVKKGDKFNFIAVQNGDLPKRFSDWKKVYYNEKTKVSLYTKGNKTWVY